MTIFQMAEVAIPKKLFLLDAAPNSPPGPGLREGVRLALAKDGDRKQGGFKCGMTVSRQWKTRLPGGDMKGPGSELAATANQMCRKAKMRDRIDGVGSGI